MEVFNSAVSNPITIEYGTSGTTINYIWQAALDSILPKNVEITGVSVTTSGALFSTTGDFRIDLISDNASPSATRDFTVSTGGTDTLSPTPSDFRTGINDHVFLQIRFDGNDAGTKSLSVTDISVTYRWV